MTHALCLLLFVYRLLCLWSAFTYALTAPDIPRHVTVIIFPNSSSPEPHHHDPVVIPVPQNKRDSKDFCSKYSSVFATDALKPLCGDIMLAGFPIHTPEDEEIGSNEVFLFINWNTTNLTDTTQFTLTTNDGRPKGSIYFQLFGKWSNDDMQLAQRMVVDLANNKQIQTYTGPVKFPPRYFTIVVSQDDQFIDPIAVHIPDDEYKGDFCFRMRHIFTTENIIKHCLDAMLSTFPYPPDPFSANEIVLFIHDNMNSVASTTQYVVTLGSNADPAKGTPAFSILIQSFGVFNTTEYGKKTQDFIVQQAQEGKLQTFVGRPTTPFRFFTLILSNSTATQFDDPIVLQLPRVPGDFCKKNKELLLKSDTLLEKKCDEVVQKLRNFPWPIPTLNQRNYTNEVFVFINLEADIMDLTQYSMNLGRANEDISTYVQCFGMWNHLSTDASTAFIMNRGLVGLGNHSEYHDVGME